MMELKDVNKNKGSTRTSQGDYCRLESKTTPYSLNSVLIRDLTIYRAVEMLNEDHCTLFIALTVSHTAL